MQDPVALISRPFDDLGRRAQDLETLVCGTPGGSGIKGSGLTFESLLGYPAPSNLPIPPYTFASDTKIRIGEEAPGKAVA